MTRSVYLSVTYDKTRIPPDMSKSYRETVLDVLDELGVDYKIERCPVFFGYRPEKRVPCAVFYATYPDGETFRRCIPLKLLPYKGTTTCYCSNRISFSSDTAYGCVVHTASGSTTVIEILARVFLRLVADVDNFYETYIEFAVEGKKAEASYLGTRGLVVLQSHRKGWVKSVDEIDEDAFVREVLAW